MMINFLTVVNDILQSLLGVLFINSILSSKISRSKTAIIFVSIATIAYFATDPIRINIKPIFMAAVFILMIYFLYKDNVKRKIIASLSLLLIMIICEVLALLIILVITDYNFNNISEFSIQRLLASNFFNLVFISISMIASVFFNKFKGPLRRNIILILLGLPTCQIILMMSVFTHNLKNMNDNILFFTSIGMAVSIITDIAIFNTIKTQKNIADKEKSDALVSTVHDIELKYYELAIEETLKTSKLKHDILNYLQTIDTLFIGDSDYKKEIGLEMIESLKSKMESIHDVNYCENSIINVILSLKTLKAQKAGILTEITVSIPENSSIEKIDLCSIFNNLYDNSIEACINSGEECKIVIRAINKSGYMLIKFMNTNNNLIIESDNGLTTTKTNKNDHGLGLKIIKEITEKYEGKYVYEIKDCMFISTVVLKINE